MKFTVATLLVVSSLVTAEPPRFRNFAARQAEQDPAATTTGAPYEPSGWRPAGQQFNLPQRSQPQELYGLPAASYGPPPEVGEATTAEATTEQYNEAENIQRIPIKKPAPAKLQAQQDPVFLIVPQREKLIYTVQQSAPLLALPVAETKVVTPARLQSLPLSRAILSPYVQIYQ